MLDVRKIRQNPEEVRNALKLRNQNVSIEPFLLQDEQRRSLLAMAEEKKALRNQNSKLLGIARKNGASEPEISRMMEQLRNAGNEIEALDAQIAALDRDTEAFLLTLPNLPHPSVPAGGDETNNVTVQHFGSPRSFVWEPKRHEEISADLRLSYSNASADAVAPVLRGLGARLHMALVRFFLDSFRQDGYEEMLFSSDASILDLHRNAIFTASQLPSCECGFFPWRADAEMEASQILSPAQSESALQSMTLSLKNALLSLGLSGRIVELCTGCLDFCASKTLALEVWLPSRQVYVRCSSCSDCSDFAARRLGLRYRTDAKDKPRTAHTVSGSLSLRQVFCAVLETFQNDDGTVAVPECLIPIMRTDLIR